MIENPAWTIIKDIPGNELDLKYDNKWCPDTLSIDVTRSMTYKERAEWYQNGPTRTNMARKYTWAIPADVSIEWIITQLAGRKVVEIGAGTGYWAWMLSQHGVDVNAYDLHPPMQGGNHWHCRSDEVVGTQWYPVQLGDKRDLGLPENHDRVLFLCWPPYGTEMAEEVLRAYRGDTLIYIGEREGGCNADDAFFDLLEKEWELKDEGPLHQWWGLYDRLYLYIRKGK